MRPVSEETRLKMRLARLGKAPWNKGKKWPEMLGNKNAWRGDAAKRNTGNRRAQNQLKEIGPCVVCGETKERFQMIRHHKDENPLNNTPENIEFLCRADHIREHREKLVTAQRNKIWKQKDL